MLFFIFFIFFSLFIYLLHYHNNKTLLHASLLCSRALSGACAVGSALSQSGGDAQSLGAASLRDEPLQRLMEKGLPRWGGGSPVTKSSDKKWEGGYLATFLSN